MPYPEWMRKEQIASKALEPVVRLTPETNTSGIYLWLRTDEHGITWFYVGQAKNIYKRQISHYNGFDHLDKSLRKRGFKSESNPNGWTFEVLCNCDEYLLDVTETQYIIEYMLKGYQSYNKTYGSQGEGKEVIYHKPAKGYKDGLRQGYANARRDVRKLFANNLTFGVNGAPNKLKERAYEKFQKFLEEEVNEEEKDNGTT